MPQLKWYAEYLSNKQKENDNQMDGVHKTTGTESWHNTAKLKCYGK